MCNKCGDNSEIKYGLGKVNLNGHVKMVPPVKISKLSRSLKSAGSKLDDDTIEYLHNEHGLGKQFLSQIKLDIGLVHSLIETGKGV